MQIVRCENYQEYDSLSRKSHFHPYNSSLFVELNRYKCEEIHYLIFTKNDTPRLGLVLGENVANLVSHFSAPFGGFDIIGKEPSSDVLNESVLLLKNYLIDNQIRICTVIMSPLLYGKTILSKIANALLVNGFYVKYIDVNHYISVKNRTEDSFFSDFTHAARKNYNKSLKHDFVFRANDDLDFSETYSIIKQNREHKGYRLMLSLDDVIDVSKIIPIDTFLLTSQDGQNVASAIVYRLSEKVVQIIYWGHHPDYDQQNPMNYLALKIFNYYAQQGFEIVDIGPSSSNSIVSSGLSNFKESLGCESDIKFTFEIKMA